MTATPTDIKEIEQNEQHERVINKPIAAHKHLLNVEQQSVNKYGKRALIRSDKNHVACLESIFVTFEPVHLQLNLSAYRNGNGNM